jgi:Nucleoside 2-deoxyribosyltransferase
MSNRFYISSQKDRFQEADDLSNKLKIHGWERTFVWKSEKLDGPRAFGKLAEDEVRGVREADVLIALLPGGFGTHVEIGVALALGKRVIIHVPEQRVLENPYPCVFHYHPSVRILISKVPEIESIISCVSAST